MFMLKHEGGIWLVAGGDVGAQSGATLFQRLASGQTNHAGCRANAF